MTRKTVSFEEVLHWTEFNVKIHCEIDVKLVFHEILWKKNFIVYPSLNIVSFASSKTMNIVAPAALSRFSAEYMNSHGSSGPKTFWLHKSSSIILQFSSNTTKRRRKICWKSNIHLVDSTPWPVAIFLTLH